MPYMNQKSLVTGTFLDSMRTRGNGAIITFFTALINRVTIYILIIFLDTLI